MKARRVGWLFFLVFVLGLASAAHGQWSTVDVPESGSYALLYLPSGHDPSVPSPVIVFLHGSGASPEGWQSTLQPLADDLGVVLLLPRSVSVHGFGPGADHVTVELALERTAEQTAIDPRRRSIAGHSSGGAFAYVMAYSSRLRFNAVFSMGAPYRSVLELAEDRYRAPIRMHYGTNDPNSYGGARLALVEQWDRLGVEATVSLANGYGHNDWPENTLPDGFAFLLEPRWEGSEGSCFPTEEVLCVQGGRFSIQASWETPSGEQGVARVGAAETADSGVLWFFGPSNWEMLVKLLDGCVVNHHYWLLVAASTNVGWELRVTDTLTGRETLTSNAVGVLSPAKADVEALPCDY